jgi:hypothetical protein
MYEAMILYNEESEISSHKMKTHSHTELTNAPTIQKHCERALCQSGDQNKIDMSYQKNIYSKLRRCFAVGGRSVR